VLVLPLVAETLILVTLVEYSLVDCWDETV
jgi:hypothetical protein